MLVVVVVEVLLLVVEDVLLVGKVDVLLVEDVVVLLTVVGTVVGTELVVSCGIPSSRQPGSSAIRINARDNPFMIIL